jgi:hypothetical protein
METPPSGPLTLPTGVEVLDASGRGLRLRSPVPLPARGLLGLDLLLGARPLGVMARVVDSRVDGSGRAHVVELEFVALAQMDRDTLVDFLQAVGPGALGVRRAREA